MMDEFDVKNRESFKDILKKATKPALPQDFTLSIMERIEVLTIKNKNYMSRSNGFFILAIVLSIVGVYVLTFFENAFQGTPNIYIAHAFHIFIYVLISMLSGLIFYQLNNLLAYRFAEMK